MSTDNLSIKAPGGSSSQEDQVKGYEVGKGEYVVLEQEEIAAAFPESDKTLLVEGFIPSGDLDDLYFERPYYLGPEESAAQQAFALLREAMRKARVAAFAHAVLFRRMRNVVIRPYENGMIATLLSFDYEIRSTKGIFYEIPTIKSDPEMLDLAKHIISTKLGKFDPSALQDRYEAAIAELVKAKIEGKTVKTAKPAAQAKVVDLIEALRRSAAATTPASEGHTVTHAAHVGEQKAAARRPSSRRDPAREGELKTDRTTHPSTIRGVQPARKFNPHFGRRRSLSTLRLSASTMLMTLVEPSGARGFARVGRAPFFLDAMICTRFFWTTRLGCVWRRLNRRDAEDCEVDMSRARKFDSEFRAMLGHRRPRHRRQDPEAAGSRIVLVDAPRYRDSQGAAIGACGLGDLRIEPALRHIRRIKANDQEIIALGRLMPRPLARAQSVWSGS